MSNLTNAVQSILDKQAEYQTAEDYYDGTVDEIFASPAVKRALHKTGDQFRVNFAATPVNAVGNRLEITGVSGISDEANKVIDNVWTTNELELEVNNIHNRALVYGDAYLFVWAYEGELEMYYNSPKTTVVIYDTENPRLPAYGAKMWTITNDKNEDRVRVNLYYADRVEKYISIGERLPMSVKDDTFEPFVDEDTDENGVMENPFGAIPIFHFRTNRPFGKPEHFAAYGPQDMINKILITQMASIEQYGFPQRYILAGDHEQAPDAWDEDEPTGEELSGEPGEIWWLKNVQKVGQFDAAKPDTYLAPYREYIRSMASVTETPLHYFENTHTNVSGESLRAAEAPLVKKVRTRQLSFGATWREVFKFIILVETGRKEDVQVHWKSIESIDTKEQWEINYKKVQAGLPESQMLLEQGYDPALVEKWEQEKAERALEAQNGPNTTGQNDGPDGKDVIEDAPNTED